MLLYSAGKPAAYVEIREHTVHTNLDLSYIRVLFRFRKHLDFLLVIGKTSTSTTHQHNKQQRTTTTHNNIHNNNITMKLLFALLLVVAPAAAFVPASLFARPAPSFALAAAARPDSAAAVADALAASKKFGATSTEARVAWDGTLLLLLFLLLLLRQVVSFRWQQSNRVLVESNRVNRVLVAETTRYFLSLSVTVLYYRTYYNTISCSSCCLIETRVLSHTHTHPFIHACLHACLLVVVLFTPAVEEIDASDNR
jgi:hypothetical protein